MSQELVSSNKSSRYMRVQSYGDSLGIVIAKPFSEQLGIKKHDTVRVILDGDVLLVRKAVEEE